MNIKGIVAGVAFTAAIGAGTGVAVESHTNEIARGKIITAEACEETTPHETTITQGMVDCFEKGVPGGNEIDEGTLEADQPIQYVQTYIASQENEADSIELHRIAGWAAAPFVIGAIAIWFYDD